MLAAFEAAARTGNFSLAAEELNFCQSAISRQIRALEDRLGTELFVRDRQRVTLTNAGESYARDIREALRHIGAASQAIKSNPHMTSLHLAVLPSFSNRWLMPRLHSFLEKYPLITINFTSKTTAFDIQAEPFDCALHFGDAAWSGAESIRIMGESVVPMASQALAKAYNIRKPADLVLAKPLLLLKNRTDAWERWFLANHVEYDPVTGALFDQFEAVAAAAKAGLGVALLPRFLFSPEIERGELVPLLQNDTPSEGAYYFLWPQDRRDNPAMKCFREWIIAEAASEPNNFCQIKTNPFPEPTRRRSKSSVSA